MQQKLICSHVQFLSRPFLYSVSSSALIWGQAALEGICLRLDPLQSDLVCSTKPYRETAVQS